MNLFLSGFISSLPNLLGKKRLVVVVVVDGKVREARVNYPKGFTVADRGNIYVADAMNMAIRKISGTGKLKCPVVG